MQFYTFVLRRPCGITEPRTCRCNEHEEIQRLIQGGRPRAALDIIGKDLCHEVSRLIGPRFCRHVWRSDRKISFVDRIAEQGRGGFLFLITGRVGNSASMIQMTHIFTGLHSAVSLRCLQELFFASGCEGGNGSTVMFFELHEFSQYR